MSPSDYQQVHLGAGAFARGHTWLCTARAVADAPGSWSVFAVANRSEQVIEALRSHDWKYSVVERDDSGASVTEVDVVKKGLTAAREPEALLSAMTDPQTTVITVSSTEAAYPRLPGGALNRRAVGQDLSDGGMRTLVGQVVAAARSRSKAETGPVSVVVCDNIIDGGEVLRALCIEFAELRGEDSVAEWLSETATFPNSVVDRIVPAVTDAIRVEAEREVGALEQGTVVTEPFFRWIIEDDFAAPRPDWEHGGAHIVPDIRPWQNVKLTLVNAPHSYLAYLGLLAGHATTREAVTDPLLRRGLEQALEADLVPTVMSGPGLAPSREAESSLTRFANPFIRHKLAQIGSGGAAKLRQRLQTPIRFAADQGHNPEWLALIVAAWGTAVDQGLVDGSIGSSADRSARGVALVDAAGLSEVAVPEFSAMVGRLSARLEEHGARATLNYLLGQKRTKQ